MADKEDIGKMAEYYINKDIESMLINRMKHNLEYLENMHGDIQKYADQIYYEMCVIKLELEELGVKF